MATVLASQAVPTDPIYFAELRSIGDLFLDGGVWLWIAPAWLLFVGAFRRAPERIPTWPLIVMVWSVGRVVGLFKYGLQAPGHGYPQFSFFAWMELTNFGWQGLVLVAVLVVAGALDHRSVALRHDIRSGALGALAGIVAVLYCWFTLAVATAGPILGEAVKRTGEN